MFSYNLDWEICRKVANRTCYLAGIRYEDREDFVQDVLLEMMERARQDSGGLSSKEMWRAARCVRGRYWRAYKKARGISSLNAPVRDTGIELLETVAGDKAVDLDALLDAKTRLKRLPPGIVRLGKKMEKENPLTENQRLYLSRFRKGEIKSSKHMIERYNELRTKGLCVSCGEESDNYVLCPSCREKHRAEQKKYRESKKGKVLKKTLRDHWRKQGRCPKCGEIPARGYKICPSCLAKNQKYLKGYRERRV